jgi:hypothetical protein
MYIIPYLYVIKKIEFKKLLTNFEKIFEFLKFLNFILLGSFECG